MFRALFLPLAGLAVLFATVLGATVCPRDVVDTMDSDSMSKCKGAIKSAGSQLSAKLGSPLTASDPALQKLLDLPMFLAGCILKVEGLVTGDAAPVYKKDTFVDASPNMNEIAKQCKLSTPGVCPFKELDSTNRLNCLPHPAPFMQCFRNRALKPCSGGGGGAAAATTAAPAAAAATTAAPSDEGGDGGDGGDGGGAGGAAAAATTAAAAAPAATAAAASGGKVVAAEEEPADGEE